MKRATKRPRLRVFLFSLMGTVVLALIGIIVLLSYRGYRNIAILGREYELMTGLHAAARMCDLQRMAEVLSEINCENMRGVSRDYMVMEVFAFYQNSEIDCIQANLSNEAAASSESPFPFFRCPDQRPLLLVVSMWLSTRYQRGLPVSADRLEFALEFLDPSAVDDNVRLAQLLGTVRSIEFYGVENLHSSAIMSLSPTDMSRTFRDREFAGTAFLYLMMMGDCGELTKLRRHFQDNRDNIPTNVFYMLMDYEYTCHRRLGTPEGLEMVARETADIDHDSRSVYEEITGEP